MSLLFTLDFQKIRAAPDFKNQPETARCLFDFCEQGGAASFCERFKPSFCADCLLRPARPDAAQFLRWAIAHTQPDRPPARQ
jgi:hypothetical protein